MRRFALVVFALVLPGCDVVFGLDRPPIQPDATTPGDWTAISAGNAFTCGLREGGRLWCWGFNRFGQVGAGMPEAEVTTPRQVLPSTSWKAVAAGGNHACAIQSDDTLWCWGGNFDGQLGIGSTVSKREPVQVTGGGAWDRVAAGGDHACAFKTDGSLWCWGRNEVGQLGDGTRTVSWVPKQVGAGTTWATVTLGRRHTCAIAADRRRYCWGGNSAGELGIGDLANKVLPTLGMERPNETTWKQLAAGDQVTCGITEAGALRCWGENRAGQLGDDTTTVVRSTPYPIASDHTDWIDVQVGSRVACARRAEGEMWCWGDVGPVLPVDSTRVPAVLDAGARWDAIAVGTTHVCRLAPDRGLYCAGDGSAGQRGDGTGATTTPVQVGGVWSEADVGSSFTCAIDPAGQLACWGENDLGQIGDDTHLRRLVPQQLAAGAWTTLGVGDEHACASVGGVMSCWGTSSGGSLGVVGVNRSAVPVAVSGAVTASQFDVSDHACAIDGGQLRCWGRNNRSQLTSGLPIIEVPTTITAVGVSAWRGVATGLEHTCGIAQDDTVRCVGDNGYGQLGDGTMATRTAFVAGGGVSPKGAIVAGDHHTCSIDLTDGDGTCWGRNSEGALGDGTTDNRSLPVAIAGNHAWSRLSGGEMHTCGIDTQTGLWCWGSNYRGQLGIGTLEHTTMPMRVDGSGWTAVHAGQAHTCARKGTELWCWGDNRSGQLGTGAGWVRAFALVPLP